MQSQAKNGNASKFQHTVAIFGFTVFNDNAVAVFGNGGVIKNYKAKNGNGVQYIFYKLPILETLTQKQNIILT